MVPPVDSLLAGNEDVSSRAMCESIHNCPPLVHNVTERKIVTT